MALSSVVEIARPPDVVFSYVTDPARFPEWQQGVVEAHFDRDGPAAVGDRCSMTRRIGFAKRVVTSEVTHVDPPRTWGVRGVDGPVRAVVDLAVEPIEGGNGSRITIDIDFTGHGLGKVIVPLAVRPQARTEMPANLRRLKQRLETAPAR